MGARENPSPPRRVVQLRRALPWAAVFLLAAAVRLALVHATADLPLSRFPALDSRQYLVWAGWILDGRFDWPQPTVQGPAYPMLLAGLLAVTGGSLAGVAALQALIGACSAVLTMAIAARWFDRRSAIAAGLLHAVYAPIALADTSILVEGLLLFLLSAFVLVFVAKGASTRGLFAAGVLAGLAAICRTTALPLALAFAALLLLERVPWRARARRAAAFALGLALLTLPVAAKNAVEGAGWQLQGKGGFNVWIGNTTSGDGLASFRLGRGWDRADGEAARAGIERPADQDRYYLARTLREIAEAPGTWLRILAAKAIWSTQHEEVRDSLSFHFFAAEVPWLRWLPGFGLVIGLAMVGAIATIRAAALPRELIVWLAVTWLTLVLLVVGYRYRLPLVPPLIVLAGAGAAALIASIGARAWRTAAVYAAVAAAAGLASLAWRHAPSHVLAEELAFTGHALQAERRFTEAEAVYRDALARDPSSAIAWMGLGVRFSNIGELEKARQALLRAVEIDPAFADAWIRLAGIADREGDLEGAAAHARRAAAVHPTDPEIRRLLSRYVSE